MVVVVVVMAAASVAAATVVAAASVARHKALSRPAFNSLQTYRKAHKLHQRRDLAECCSESVTKDYKTSYKGSKTAFSPAPGCFSGASGIKNIIFSPRS